MEEMKLTEEEIKGGLEKLSGWEVREGKLYREFEFARFMDAIGFVSRVAELAEAINHHPDMCIYYKKVVVELWTHKFKGLPTNQKMLPSTLLRRNAVAR